MAVELGLLCAQIRQRLAVASDAPQLESEILLAHILKQPRSWVVAHPEHPLDPAVVHEIEVAVGRLAAGEPLAYITSHREFYGFDFLVTRDVLIPRPETEQLVERAIKWMQGGPERRTVADIGTGSGCIAVSIARNVDDAHVLATDLSHKALVTARANAERAGVSNQIDLVVCNILPRYVRNLPTERHFDVLCANLPYIPTDALNTLPVHDWEPTLALDGGPDGLTPFRRLFDVAPDWMAPHSLILLELESTRGAAVLSLAYDSFHAASIHLYPDLAGHDRLLEIQLP